MGKESDMEGADGGKVEFPGGGDPFEEELNTENWWREGGSGGGGGGWHPVERMNGMEEEGGEAGITHAQHSPHGHYGDEQM